MWHESPCVTPECTPHRLLLRLLLPSLSRCCFCRNKRMEPEMEKVRTVNCTCASLPLSLPLLPLTADPPPSLSLARAFKALLSSL